MRKLLFAFASALLVSLSALQVASARPRSAAPAVVTGTATAVTENSASIGGTVTPNGAPTRYWFEYGTSTSYGFQTPMRFAGAGQTGVAVAANLHHLQPGTVYHYRLDASNNGGAVQGADATFTTTAAAVPVVVTGSATAVTEHSASVGGTVTPNGQPTRFWFEYGASTSYGSQTPMRPAGAGLSAVAVAANIRALTPGTLYHYRLDASSSAGTVQGADATFTTAAAALPVVVTGSATAVTEHSATVGGTVTPNGQPTRFWFQYGTSASYGSQTPTRFAGGGLSAVTVTAGLRGLAPGTLYHYRLDAANASGTVEGADATFTTTAAALPAVVTGSATAVTEHSATVGGTVTPNGQPTRYWFEYGTSTSYGSHTRVRFAGAGLSGVSVAAALRGLTPGTLYHFRLDASNASGTVDGADATFTTTAAALPAVVTGSASAVSEHRATLGGTVTPNGSPTRYWFEYGTSTSYGSHTPVRFAGAGMSAVTVAARLYGLTPGTLYHFRLDAANSAGTVDGADGTFTTTAAAAPAVVTGSASAVSEHRATLGGTVTPNGQPTRYWFEYGTSTSYGRHTRVHFAGAGTSPVTVAARLFGLTPGTLYHFRLDAANSAGTVDGADATFTTTAATAPGAVTDAASNVTRHRATVGGIVTPNGSRTRFWFEYGTSTSYGRHTRVRFAGRGLTGVSVRQRIYGLTPGTLYHFRLDAANAAGTVDGADETFTTAAKPPPPPPHEWFAGSVTAVGTSSLTVGVSWTGPHDGYLDGQTITVAVPTSTRISRGPHHTPIALAQIQVNDLVGLHTFGQPPAGLTALRIHVDCDCHWVGGTISGINPSTASFTVQVKRTGPYDGVLEGQNVTMQTNADTVYMHGRHRRREGFGGLRVGQGVGVVFAANGFFQAPGFNWRTATFTAKRVHTWGRGQVPPPASDADLAAQT